MKKMDEMELYHTLQSIRIVYFFSIIFELTCWISKCVLVKKIIFTDMFFLIIFQFIILTIGQLYFKTRVDDPQGKNGIILFISISIITLIIGLLVTYFGG